MSAGEEISRPVDAVLAAYDALSIYQERNREFNGGLEPPICFYNNYQGQKRHGLIDIVSERAGLKSIKIKCLTENTPNILGGTRRYGEHALIWIAGGLNICWSRFVIAKELSNLLIGEEGNFTEDLSSFVIQVSGRDFLPQNMGTIMQAEEAAYTGAMEILLPKFLSERYFAMISEPRGIRSVAELFRTPEAIVAIRTNSRVRIAFEQNYTALPKAGE